LVKAISCSSSSILFITCRSSIPRLPHFHLHHHRKQPCSGTYSGGVRYEGVETPAKQAREIKNQNKKKSRFEIENLTTWLLKQEQAGNIDAELTIVISSISSACKRIASLLQRSSIINLTGAHGTINIQGEDQKKLDVISNEIHQRTPILIGSPDEVEKLLKYLA
ncbi:FBPase domain-containing protein, partial [Cephalotus follicularis]